MAPEPSESAPETSESASAPAKLLLFGEHTVLHGSGALAVPLPGFSARLRIRDPTAAPTTSDADVFASWLTNARSRPELTDVLDFATWEREATCLSVASDIPRGYGVGSSGALTALAYRRYATPAADVPTSVLRARLAALEGFFHGRSSGLDPLVCYANRPIRIAPGGGVELLRDRLDLTGWFLLDSRRSRTGQEAIAAFGARAQNRTWRTEVLPPLAELTDRLIAETLLGAPAPGLLRALSERQLAALPFLIPTAVEAVWRRWLGDGVAYLKLCGAGAGGFYLGYARNPAALHDDERAGDITWL